MSRYSVSSCSRLISVPAVLVAIAHSLPRRDACPYQAFGREAPGTLGKDAAC